MTEEFSPAGYRELLDRLLATGYQSVAFDRAQAGRPHLLLRHDLDMSLQAAEPMAEAERALGLSATYFVLLRTEMYNPMSRAGRRSLARLLELGHEVGLHFDASAYVDEQSALDAAAEAECHVLEQLTGRTVRIVSFHRPAESLLGRAEPVAGRMHTYMPRFFSEIGYCSDSQGRWRFGHPLGHQAVIARRALQLLTHPIWWLEPGGLDPVARLDRFAAERGALLKKELAQNCIPYRQGQQQQDSTESA